METIEYAVLSFNGDYVFLQNCGEPDLPPKQVARALLPDGISEGSRLKWEAFEYELIG